MANARPTVKVVCALLLCASGCVRQDARLAEHRKNFESLGATTAAVTRAWLDGQVSGTYARTALERTYVLVERERSAMAASPQMISDPRGADLSRKAERLARMLAGLITNVRASDSLSARAQIEGLPIGTSGRQ